GSINCRCRGASVFAQRGVNAMGQADGQVRKPFLDQRFKLQLMDGIDDRPEEAHRHRFNAGVLNLLENTARLNLVERMYDVAARSYTFRHLEGQRTWNVGPRIGDRVVEKRQSDPPAFPQHEYIGMARSRNERGTRGLG